MTTLHDSPLAVDRSAAWDRGVSFQTFLPTAQDNVDLWIRTYERARVPDDILARLDATAGAWKLLVLSADWCGDASNTIPVLAALADAAPTVDLRMLERDENLGLMDDHLTNGTARAIPVVIVLDATGTERAWWGPRPQQMQTWFASDEAQALDKPDRYRELRKMYARDRGASTLDQVVTLIERAAGGRAVL